MAEGPPGYFTLRIEDETGFYNLNRLVTHAGAPAEIERAVRLFRLAGARAELAGPIADWVDADSSPAAYPPGAEASQYAAEDRDVPPRNAPLGTFRELALVLGMDAENLRKIRTVATVLPRPLPTAPEGALINVNTAPLRVLQSLSEDLDDESLLAALNAQRCTQPFLSTDDLKTRLPEIERTGIVSLLTVKSAWFRIRSTAHVGDSTQSVEALLHRQGAQIEAQYLLAQRGANIDHVDSPTTAGFEVPAAGGSGARL